MAEQTVSKQSPADKGCTTPDTDSRERRTMSSELSTMASSLEECSNKINMLAFLNFELIEAGDPAIAGYIAMMGDLSNEIREISRKVYSLWEEVEA